MEPYNPSQNFQTMYSPLGIFQGGVQYAFQTVLPAGMVPNLSLPTNAKAMQSGTPFTSEMNMQSGTLFAGVELFPESVEEALGTPYTGYRLGLDIKDNNIAKFFIGDNQNFLFWDGIRLLLNGQLRVYGEDNRIQFYDRNQVLQGFIFADNTGMIFDSTSDMIIGANNDITLLAGNAINIKTGTQQMMFFDGTPGTESVDMFVPFGFAQLPADPVVGVNGWVYYNTTTDELRAYVAGAWGTIQVI